jgi:hypothetical protein
MTTYDEAAVVQAAIDIAHTTASERVARGARWLDEFIGEEWVNRIDPDTLNLESDVSCICGQVFEVNGANLSGFTFAERTLFTEANSWISGIVAQATIANPTAQLDTPEKENRATMVAAALGFLTLDEGSLVCTDAAAHTLMLGLDEAGYVSYYDLEDAWLELLNTRRSK